MKRKHILLVGTALLLSSCAAKTPPAFLQNAAAGMWGGIITTPEGAVMAPKAERQRTGFDTFFGEGGGE